MKRVIVGIPALNESGTIARVIKDVPPDIGATAQVDVVVVDDGSTDDTGSVARSAGAKVIKHDANRGLGAAFQTLAQYALRSGADILVTIDADGQFNPLDIPTLVDPIVAGRASVVTASRFADASVTPKMPWGKKWGNRQVAALVSRLTGRRYSDVSCGFRAYSREALLRMTVFHSFTYTHETFLDLTSKGFSIIEIPVSVRGTRESGQSKMASNLFRYGLETGKIILRSYRDKRPFRLCGYLAGLLVSIGAALFIVSLFNLLRHGVWLKWAAMAGGTIVFLAIAVLFLGFLADSVNCLRRNQEEILYLLRKQSYDAPREEPKAGTEIDARKESTCRGAGGAR